MKIIATFLLGLLIINQTNCDFGIVLLAWSNSDTTGPSVAAGAQNGVTTHTTASWANATNYTALRANQGDSVTVSTTNTTTVSTGSVANTECTGNARVPCAQTGYLMATVDESWDLCITNQDRGATTDENVDGKVGLGCYTTFIENWQKMVFADTDQALCVSYYYYFFFVYEWVFKTEYEPNHNYQWLSGCGSTKFRTAFKTWHDALSSTTDLLFYNYMLVWKVYNTPGMVVMDDQTSYQAGNKTACDNAFTGTLSTAPKCGDSAFLVGPYLSTTFLVNSLTSTSLVQTNCAAATNQSVNFQNCCLNSNVFSDMDTCVTNLTAAITTSILGTWATGLGGTELECLAIVKPNQYGDTAANVLIYEHNCGSPGKRAEYKIILNAFTADTSLSTATSGVFAKMQAVTDVREDHVYLDTASHTRCDTLFATESACAALNEYTLPSTDQTVATNLTAACADSAKKANAIKHAQNCCKSSYSVLTKFKDCLTFAVGTFSQTSFLSDILGSETKCTAGIHKLPLTQKLMAVAVLNCKNGTQLGVMKKCVETGLSDFTDCIGKVVVGTTAAAAAPATAGSDSSLSNAAAAANTALCACSGAILKALGLGFAVIMIMNLFN